MKDPRIKDFISIQKKTIYPKCIEIEEKIKVEKPRTYYIKKLIRNHT